MLNGEERFLPFTIYHSPSSFMNQLTTAKMKRRGEAGYTLVALLAVMTIIAAFAAAAAPNIKQQAQRSREEEAIFRGEEVAEAIRLYVRYTGRLPTSIEDLRKGVTRG